MSESALLVPVFLDGLVLAQGIPVQGPLTDFRGLPYVGRDGDRLVDERSDTPWLGSVTSRAPLSGCDAWLAPGVHLHWALPDGLCHADKRGADRVVTFRAVPDRWLVTRWRGETLERRWLVESNYLWPHDQTWTDSHIASGVHPDALVSYLLPRALRVEGTPPWRFLGRKLDLDAGEVPGDPADRARYLRGLTAIGCGDAHFAAYYPSCRSVFGLHDPEVTTADPEVSYAVHGWYATPDDDPVRGLSEERWAEELVASLRWQPAGDGQPVRTLCAGMVPATGLDGAAPTITSTRVALAEDHLESLAALWGAQCGEAKERVEQVLESLMVADDPDLTRDPSPSVEAALHGRRFDNTMGDPIFAVRANPIGPSGLPGPDALAAAQDPTLPEALALDLNRLNDVQRALTAAANQLDAARELLFQDWCRVQLNRHPPADMIEDWSDAVAGHDLDVLRAFLSEERIAAVTACEAVVRSAAGARDAALAEMEQAVAAHNAASLGDAAPTERWAVVVVQGPQYHTPTPPSVAILGVEATDRHHRDGDGSEDGTLVCAVVDADPHDWLLGAPVPRGLCRAPAEGAREVARWHPLFMEWEAEVSPVGAGHTTDPTREDLAPTLIRDSYDFREGDLELRPRGIAPAPYTAAVVGRGFLAHGIQDLARTRLHDWLRRRLRGASEVSEAQRSLDVALADVPALRALFPADDPIQTVLDLRGLVDAQPVLTQSLTGFHEALLMVRPDAALEVDDPLGFDDDLAFAREVVAPAVGAFNDRCPEVAATFLPLRTGDLGLSTLQLVDIWGRPTPIPVHDMVTTERLRSGRALPVSLPARVVQPARLSLRWLDALHDEEEMNTHPASSPVCGWLVPDTLVGHIHVYDAEGAPQGSIDAQGRWRVVPGSVRGAMRPLDLANPHLAKVVDWMVGQSEDEIGALVDTLETALELISPATNPDQASRALLMGRPIAVVRARIAIELQHPPAADQSIQMFERSVSEYVARRTVHDALTAPAAGDAPPSVSPTRGFERVQIPIRLGEHGQLDDGVVGYFIEQEDGSYRGDTLWAPQSRTDYVGDRINAWEDGESFHVWHALADPPFVATILMDPRAVIHATCGVLPLKSVSIPREEVEPALRAIAVTFPVAPVLSPAGRLEIPLPEVAGWSWSWLSREGGRWQHTSRQATLDAQVLAASFPDQTDLWPALHAAGWLTDGPDLSGQASIVDVSRRPPLPASLLPLQAAIERVLDTAGRVIGHPATDARFAPRLTLREGWLRLSPAETPE